MWAVLSNVNKTGLHYLIINTQTQRFYIKPCGRCVWSSTNKEEADLMCFDLNNGNGKEEAKDVQTIIT